MTWVWKCQVSPHQHCLFGKKFKQEKTERENERVWEQETERHDKLDKFLYCTIPNSKYTSVFFRPSIKFFKIYISLNWVMVTCKTKTYNEYIYFILFYFYFVIWWVYFKLFPLNWIVCSIHATKMCQIVCDIFLGWDGSITHKFL